MSTQLLPASRYLVHSGLVVAADMSVSDQVLIEDGLIVAVGGAAHEAARHGGSVRRVDLGGSIVTAAFVDAHVHLTATGLMMSGLDLSAVRSSRQLLVKLSEYSSSRSGAIIIGHGWDDSRFDEQGLPTPAELDRASGGRPVYLTRIDVHSALVSQSLLDLLPGIAGDQGYRDSDPVAQAAHGRARTYVMSHLSGEQRKAAQTAALRHAAAEGVASVHENGGPVVSSASDLQSALALGQDAGMPEVIGYWGELFGTDTAVSLGAHGVAGDLFVDGSLGSHTAFLCDDYTDSSGRGACYIGEDDLVE
ncbi:MAG: amidohydrolase, partial [Actinobacteria bacterium]|nr:amidohydrolase [Actinomycetota bacterium]